MKLELKILSVDPVPNPFIEKMILESSSKEPLKELWDCYTRMKWGIKTVSVDPVPNPCIEEKILGRSSKRAAKRALGL